MRHPPRAPRRHGWLIAPVRAVEKRPLRRWTDGSCGGWGDPCVGGQSSRSRASPYGQWRYGAAAGRVASKAVLALPPITALTVAVAPAMPPWRLALPASRSGGRPGREATGARRDLAPSNRARRRPDRCRRRCRHRRSEQLATDTMPGCRTDQVRRQRDREAPPAERPIFHAAHR